MLSFTPSRQRVGELLPVENGVFLRGNEIIPVENETIPVVNEAFPVKNEAFPRSNAAFIE